MVDGGRATPTRRRTLGLIGAVGASGAAALWGIGWRPGGRRASAGLADPHYSGDPVAAGSGPDVSPRPLGRSPVAIENTRPGAAGFSLSGHRFATDRSGEIAGYASATSVAPGEELVLRVSVAPAQRYRATVFRIGHYGGAGARMVVQGPWLDGTTQPAPAVSPETGAVSCAWSPRWRLRIGADWTSGLYLALLSTADGHHHWVPFVVRDPSRTAAGLVVIPTSTYQAYNQWPMDGRTGASLYYGFDDAGKRAVAGRSRAVSHDRPYAGSGLPNLVADDIGFVQWAEAQGLDLAYATSEDLHTGRIEPGRHRAVIFPGHDEYWSTRMRSAVVTARNGGTSLVFLGANNCYWRIRFGGGDRDERQVWCDKVDTPRKGVVPVTPKWRATTSPEQQLIGSQYVSVVDGRAPLVVGASGHWFWAGTGVRDGDRIPGVVWGEADQWMSDTAGPQLVEEVQLADSPFTRKGKTVRQHTRLYRAPSGAWVFAAGSLGWTRTLHDPALADPRMDRATRNLLRQVLGGDPAGADQPVVARAARR
ncbi:N,N-dimethylformamidase beta subunit family domain-containing protein [Micromonospora sp. NPDC047707]|uniref:N,N-dimethylformamidase beta subunit family domain-containing protein n=1 Tax=Micromonospora sp. NPDC047707 TaxID=3154498 RepID=UPI0034573A95